MRYSQGETPQVEMKPVLTSDFVAPIEAGAPAGVMEYYIDGQKMVKEKLFSAKILKR